MTPCDLPAHVLATRLARRELTAVEVLEAQLERIDKHNPALNAVVSLNPELARKQAEAADVALSRGELLGPLHGVPMTLKDAHDVAGLRTTAGTPKLDRMADEDGTVAARLRAAGAIIIGHTNVPPWLADYQSANPIFGRSNNPWDTERTPGGSSGGAAAALAAGLTPLEIGSDLAGSVRLPAHFCGVYGLTATEHRVPSTGFLRLPADAARTVRIMGSLGPMARDLADLRLALEIIAGPDGRDTDVPPVPLDPPRRCGLPALRLAVAPMLPGTPVAAGVRHQVERVAAQAADAGAQVEERLPDLDWEASHELFRDLLGTITGVADPSAELRAEQRTLAWYFEALTRRDRFIAAWHTFFADIDALIVPAAMTTAFPHRDNDPTIDVDGLATSYVGNGGALVFANLTGLPSLVAPAGLDNGLPVGVQLIGPRWSETRLLDIAAGLEEAEVLPGFQPPPGY